MNWCKWLCLSSILIIINGQFILLMSPNETKKLIGIDAQLFYVLGEEVMVNAVTSSLTLNTSIDDHLLYWQNQNVDKQVGYSIDFTTDNDDGLILPISLNISATGVVPSQLSGFSMRFECTGKRSSTDISINFNISNWLASRVVSFSLKRTKLCVTGVTSRGVPVATGKETQLPGYNGFGKDSILMTGSYAVTKVPKASSTEIFYVAVGVASTIIILVAVVIFTLYVRTRKQTLVTNDRPSVIGSSNHGSSHLRLDHNKHSSVQSLPSSRRGTLSSYSQPPPTQDLHAALQSMAINRKSVTLKDTVIEGAFGKVLHGVVYVQDETDECYEQKVLIKTLSDATPEDGLRALLIDGCMLRGLNHPGINPIIGACLEAPPLLIYPACDKGNLKYMLKNSNRISEHYPVLNTQQLVSMAMQVVKGLHYLHRKHVIHRDIATRNCCVDGELNVKVTDSALSEDLFPDDYVHGVEGDLRPVKWMAFESLTDGKYTCDTDIWSFGVLLWELITFAQQPYNDVDPSDMSSYLYSGCRLLQPANCPDELFAIMAYCWAVHPCDRPSLTQILACLREFHSTLSSFV